MTAATRESRKVLIVSFYFPPTNTIAAVRLGKFAKYLPEFGWKPVVLTADKVKGFPPTLPLEMEEANIFRVPNFSLVSSLYSSLVGTTYGRPLSQNHSCWSPIRKCLRLAQPLSDLCIFHPRMLDGIGWYLYAVRKGRDILKQYRIDAIFSSYGPSSSHLVASRLHRVSGIPWVAEFRDLWALNHNARTTCFSRFFEERFEKKVMKGSSAMIVASEAFLHQLERLHGKRVVNINNGFDEEDYTDTVPLTSKFTITYTGNLYAGKQDPTPLLQAIAELNEEGKIHPESFEVRFFGGRSLAPIAPLIGRYGLTQLVKIYDFIPFKECIKRQQESSVLLFLKWNNASARGIYTGKLFEYLGAQRPVLAVGSFKDELVDGLLTESGTGVAPADAYQIKFLLSRWLEEWRRMRQIDSYWKPKPDLIQMYTRRRQAQKLANILEEVSESKKPCSSPSVDSRSRQAR